MSAVFPKGRPFVNECGQSFHGIVGGHQIFEIQTLHSGQLQADALVDSGPGGTNGEAQGTGTSQCEMFLEIGEGSLLGIFRQDIHQSDPMGLLGPDAAPREQQVLGMSLADALRQQTGCRGREDRQLDFGLPQRCDVRGENQMPGGCDLETASQTLPLYRHHEWDRALQNLKDQGMKLLKHPGAGFRQVLFHAGAKAEMWPLRIQEYRT